MTKSRSVNLVAGILILITVGGADKSDAKTLHHDELRIQVDELFAEYADPTAPRGAVGIVHHGKVINTKGFGAAHASYDAPITPQTVFDIASASKSAVQTRN